VSLEAGSGEGSVRFEGRQGGVHLLVGSGLNNMRLSENSATQHKETKSERKERKIG
jgi:hypothetical protein